MNTPRLIGETYSGFNYRLCEDNVSGDLYAVRLADGAMVVVKDGTPLHDTLYTQCDFAEDFGPEVMDRALEQLKGYQLPSPDGPSFFSVAPHPAHAHHDPIMVVIPENPVVVKAAPRRTRARKAVARTTRRPRARKAA